MKLQYDFPIEVRNLFIGYWKCWQCGRNGQDRGGLELHHIFGRVSSSALNAAILCHTCHDSITGSIEERKWYLIQTFRHLVAQAQIGAFRWGPAEDAFISLIPLDFGKALSTVT